MSRYCPLTESKVLYLQCLECEDKACRKIGTDNNMFYCIVTGSYSSIDYQVFCKKMDHLLKNTPNVCIVYGLSNELGEHVRRYVGEHDCKSKEFGLDRNSYGNAAYIMRDREMCEYVSSQGKAGMVIFKDVSKNVEHSIKLAKEFNIDLRIVEYIA